MLDIVNQTPTRGVDVKRKRLDTIRSLPDATKEKLSALLEHENDDWKRLAEFFDLSSLIDFMEKQASPTLKLLNYLDVHVSNKYYVCTCK